MTTLPQVPVREGDGVKVAVPSTTDEHPVPHSQSGRTSLRQARLRKSARFQAIRGQGRWWSHRLLAMGVLANGLALSRCGFSVSKRVGTAVVRNRIRRRLREIARERWPDVPPGWDVVFAAREPLREADFSEIRDAVGTLLLRARLLGEKGT